MEDGGADGGAADSAAAGSLVGVVVGSSDVIRAKLLWPLWTRVSGAWKADEPMSIAWTSPGSIDVSGERNLERGFYYFLWALLYR